MVVHKRYAGFGTMSPTTGKDCPAKRDSDGWFAPWNNYCNCMYPPTQYPEQNAKCKEGIFPPWTVAGKIDVLNKSLPDLKSAIEEALAPAPTADSQAATASLNRSVMEAVRSGAVKTQGVAAPKLVLVKAPDGSMYQQGVVVDDGGLPGWVLPVGIGAGVLAIGAAIVARRRK